MANFTSLDPLLHNQLRLAIMSLAIASEKVEFTQIVEKTNATRGNVSANLKKLTEAGYLEMQKSFRNNFPLTTCSITPKGIEAFEEYVADLENYLRPKS